MSNKNNDVMMENVPTRNVGYRLFAVLLIAICALSVVGFKFYAIYDVANLEFGNGTLLTILKDLFASDYTVLGVLPAFVTVGTISAVYTLSFYLFIAALAIAVVMAVIAIFSAKNAPKLVRIALFYLTAGALLYTFSFTLTCEAYAANNVVSMEGSALSKMPLAIDVFSLILAALGMVLCFFFAKAKVGKVAGLYFVQALLSIAFMAMIASPITKSTALVGAEIATLTKLIVTAGIVAVIANTLISIGRMSKDGGIAFDLTRYFLVLIVALLILAKTQVNMFGIMAAIVAVLQVVIVIVQLIQAKRKAVDDAREEATIAATSNFHLEEFAEAYPYEGGPVAGVVMAEEVNPSFLPHEPHVTTAGYDFYNCKSFDPFIATLNEAERNEFTELFILKFKGTMPELPDYDVGGDNKEFFRKMFIYLGQYRDRMSQPLLMKMYQFSMKI